MIVLYLVLAVFFGTIIWKGFLFYKFNKEYEGCAHQPTHGEPRPQSTPPLETPPPLIRKKTKCLRFYEKRKAKNRIRNRIARKSRQINRKLK